MFSENETGAGYRILPRDGGFFAKWITQYNQGFVWFGADAGPT